MISLLATASRQPFTRPLAPVAVTILLYHSIPPTTERPDILDAHRFEEQVRYLKREFTLVGPNQRTQARRLRDRPQVLLTFDDGFRNNAEVVAPILRKYRAPAIFFVSSRHIRPGKLLWFSYLSGLLRCFRGDGFSFRGCFYPMRHDPEASIAQLTKALLELTPHPSAMYQAIEEELPKLEEFATRDELREHWEGMTPEQVRGLAADPLFTIGAHTVDHPFLTRCTPAEMRSQIRENKHALEKIINAPCDKIAYPLSDYNQEVIEYCRKEGFAEGYSVHPPCRFDPQMEIRRMGVYSASREILSLKTVWGPKLHRVLAFWSRLQRPERPAQSARNAIAESIRTPTQQVPICDDSGVKS